MRSTRPIWRYGLVIVALLAGLFGMHALSGAPGAGPSAAGHHLTASPWSTQHDSGVASSARPEAPQRHGDQGLANACLAALCVAVLFFAALAFRRRIRRWWVLLPREGRRGRRLATYLLAAGPPAVWRFSVIRC
ncbi:DUF6153 family protein [Nocardioides daejeonensis]|uniref:DUF6153 family protein n=1 Tax=Nocardioides daejeonensis TaxID=1046556 RepID=UPI000D74A42D|nr:DUF6153 family protein [Nocardioides daejeonensis]